jgi:hypothetical protein
MPVVSFNYTGLNITALSNVWLIPDTKVVESIEAPQEDNIGGVPTRLVIIIGSSVGGTVVLCCLCYFSYKCIVRH